MNEQEINAVYEKLDALFPLRLKAQIKGSGLVFKKFFELHDFMTGERFNVLVVNDRSVRFNTMNELLSGIGDTAMVEIKKVEEEVRSLEHHKTHDLRPDVYYIDNRLEGLGYRESKLWKVLNLVQKRLSC